MTAIRIPLVVGLALLSFVFVPAVATAACEIACVQGDVGPDPTNPTNCVVYIDSTDENVYLLCVY